MQRPSLEEAARYCLENPDSLSTEELLSRFPEYREDLAPVLALNARLQSSVSRPVPPEQRGAIRQRVMAAAIALDKSESGTAQTETAARRPTPWFRRVPRTVWASALLSLIALVWWLSASSLPDSPFYGVKLSTENALLNFSGSQSDLAQAHIKLANVRLYDLREMSVLNKLAQAGPAFDNFDYHLQHGLDIWKSLPPSQAAAMDKLLYVSSAAAQNVFGELAETSGLSSSLQAPLRTTVDQVASLNRDTRNALQASGTDPQQILRDVGGQLAPLLTPSAQLLNKTPTARPSTALPTPVSEATPTSGVQVEATGTAALFAAQTIVAEGGTDQTPAIPAAETVIAGGGSASVAGAVQTVVAASLAFPTSTAIKVTSPKPTVTPSLAVPTQFRILPTLTPTQLRVVPTLTPLPRPLANPPRPLTGVQPGVPTVKVP